VIKSKLTSKAQTTIPQAVRAALSVKEGDELAYQIEDGRVVVTRAPQRLPRKEWDSKEDDEDFADL
jgi:antitoxin PrlF